MPPWKRWRRTLRKPHAGMRPRILGHHQPSLARFEVALLEVLSPLPRNGGEGTKPKNAQLQNLRRGLVRRTLRALDGEQSGLLASRVLAPDHRRRP